MRGVPFGHYLACINCDNDSMFITEMESGERFCALCGSFDLALIEEDDEDMEMD